MLNECLTPQSRINLICRHWYLQYYNITFYLVSIIDISRILKVQSIIITKCTEIDKNISIA